jgi:hypothetical protein
MIVAQSLASSLSQIATAITAMLMIACIQAFRCVRMTNHQPENA